MIADLWSEDISKAEPLISPSCPADRGNVFRKRSCNWSTFMQTIWSPWIHVSVFSQINGSKAVKKELQVLCQFIKSIKHLVTGISPESFLFSSSCVAVIIQNMWSIYGLILLIMLSMSCFFVSSLRYTSEALKLRKRLSVTGVWLTAKAVNESPVCLHDFMFTPLGLFVKLPCEREPDQN